MSTISAPRTRAGILGKTWRRRIGNTLAYITLTALSLLFLIPLAWLFLTSLMTLKQATSFPPEWIPNPVQFDNYIKALKFWNFARSFRNTAIVTSAVMIGELLSCTLVAYGFARLRFPGRNFLFIVLMSTMMLPGVVTMVPLYILFSKIQWVNTFLPLTVPAFFGGAFYIFLLRQFFMTIPEELIDAARIDGAGELNIWARIMLPLSGPAIIVVAIFSFQGAWNDFMGPLIYLNNEKLHTMALSLHMFRGLPGQGSIINQMMAATVMMVLPMLIVFAVFQRYFIQGVTLTGLKG
ncbi:MAG: carbohydrate ABC transporter permease [Chloroflexi bacterium]|nr:carbohydrate ABC transporter permease [Chloroflexota bacterium]